MEQTDDRSASSIPKWLVYATMLAIVARMICFAVETHFHPKDKILQSKVEWTDFNKHLYKELKTEHEDLEPKQKISPDKKSLAILNTNLESNNSDGKYIIYQFFAPDSDPCLLMEKNALSNSQIVELLNQKLRPVRVTYRKNEKQEPGRFLIDLRRHYRVCAFPTLVIVDTRGEEVANLVGNCSSLTTYRFLSRALTKVSKTKRKNDTKLAFN